MKVYYAKNPEYQILQFTNPDMNTFPIKDFIEVKIPLPAGITLDGIFDYLNGPKNPLEKKAGQEFLEKNRISHTSMSIGDLVEEDCGKLMMCSPHGWKPAYWKGK